MSKLALCLAVLVCSLALTAAAQERRVVEISPLKDARGTVVESGAIEFAAEGPGGERVARFDDDFGLRFDLAAAKVDPHEFDLLKIQVKADAHALLTVSLENFPRPGELSHWYVLDTARTAVPWRTIWVDLNKPEEIKAAGTYKGLSEANPDLRGLLIRGGVTEIRRTIQEPGRTIRLGPVRFVKKTIDLDWDQARAPYSWEPGRDLVFRFPLTVTNKSTLPVRASLGLVPVEARNARGKLSVERLPLKPGETGSVEAMLSLPADFAAQASPLYCERFEVVASAEGLPDSDVTILRSSDAIPLSITVPFREEQLQFPLLPRVKSIPEAVTKFDAKARAGAAELVKRVSPDLLSRALDGPLQTAFEQRRGFNYWGMTKEPWHLAAADWLHELTASAFLYDTTDDPKYVEKGTQLLLQAAERFPGRLEEWRKIPYSPISHGIFSGNMLGLGWASGSTRWPYSYQQHGVFNDFDLLARGMDEKSRETILRDFVVPAAIQMRNHYFGLSNQQDVVNYPVLYAGLAGRNWPLVSHAYDSSHGLLNQIKFNFDDEGLAGEANYHKPALEPILWACELLRARGVDLYDQRLLTMLHSRAADVVGKGYDSPMRSYADQFRFAGKDLQLPPASDGLHLTTGLTLLRWKGREVSMNWGAQQNRSAPDRCSLRIDKLGGGNYTHSSLGQSIIIVDEGRQNPEPAEVIGYDVTGPAQYIAARSAGHYRGSTITRLFALLGDGVLVLDRVESDEPRIVDWCLKGAGDKLSVAMHEVAGGFTRKPDDTAHNVVFGANLKFGKHLNGQTDTGWTEGNGRLAMAGDPGTRIYSFRVEPAFSASKAEKAAGVPVLMVRRGPVKATEFVAFFSAKTRSVERVEVQSADGGQADAVGARITLNNGQVIHAIVNYRPGTLVRLGSLSTKDLFATDYGQ